MHSPPRWVGQHFDFLLRGMFSLTHLGDPKVRDYRDGIVSTPIPYLPSSRLAMISSCSKFCLRSFQ